MLQTIFYKSPVGILQLSATADALTQLHFTTETSAPLPLVPLAEQYPVLQQTVAQLNHYFSGSNLNFNIPLQQQGTPFQQSVWQALLQIPAGSTMSYMQLSKLLGNTKAIRAVGTANGKNNIAIIVPCHRVIGSNGSLVGYAGGTWRKQWLLAHEAKYCSGVQTLF